MPRRSKAIGTVLVLAERRNSRLSDHLRSRGYEVLETFTTDHAVAVATNNPVDVVVLDQDCFIETDGWSVAQSLKVAKAGICVLLATRAQRIFEEHT
jgi:DNA-binding response OmpR family regulator